jgi:hypothetical protein
MFLFAGRTENKALAMSDAELRWLSGQIFGHDVV